MSLLYDNISALTFTEMGAITNTTTLTTNKVFTKLSCPTQQHTSHTFRGQLAADHVSAAKFNTTDNSLSLALHKCQVLSFCTMEIWFNSGRAWDSYARYRRIWLSRNASASSRVFSLTKYRSGWFMLWN